MPPDLPPFPARRVPRVSPATLTTVLVPLWLLLTLTGCQALPRVVVDTTAAAAGAVVAKEASHGNPYWTAGGGLAGYLLADTALSSQDKTHQEALALAYERGRSQSAQQTYDAIQNAQKTDRRPAGASGRGPGYVEIPIVVPARSINGVLLNASVEYVRVSTP